MRRLTLLLAVALLLVQTVAWAHDEKMQAELLDEVLRLTQAEIPDEIILEQIQAWDFAFELTADDIVELRTLGVSDSVLEALIATSPVDADAAQAQVILTTGYYAPWYWFPIAWGGYWDPFPDLYCAYYYPFHYGCASFGYYGWCGGTYYAHYQHGPWQREAWNRHGPRSPYTLASGLPSQRAGTMTAPQGAPAVRQGASVPRVIRSTPSERSSATLQRANLHRASGARSAQSATTLRTTRRTPGGTQAAQTVARELGARRVPASGLGSRSVREARQATPTSRVQAPAPSRGTSLGPSRVPTWSRQAPAMPRFQSMSRGAAAPRSMSAPPSVAGRLGGRGR